MNRSLALVVVLLASLCGSALYAQDRLETQFRNPARMAAAEMLRPDGVPLSAATTPQELRTLILRGAADGRVASFRPQLEGGKGGVADQPWWAFAEPLAQLRARLAVLNEAGMRTGKVAVLLPPDGLAPSGRELTGLTAEIGARLDSTQVSFAVLRGDEGVGNWAAGARRSKALLLPRGVSLGADGRAAITALLNAGSKAIAVQGLPETDPAWVEQTFGAKPGAEMKDPVVQRGNAVYLPGDLGHLTPLLRSVQAEDLFLYPPWPAMRCASFVGKDDPGMSWFLLYNSAGQACHTYLTLYQNCEPELWDPETGAVTVAPGYRVTPAGTTLVPLMLPPEGVVIVLARRAAPSTGDDRHVTQAPGLERVSVSRQGARVVVRGLARLNGTHRVLLADGRKAKVEVSGLPTPLVLSGGWSFRAAKPFTRQPTEITAARVRALHEGDDSSRWSAAEADLSGWDLAKIGDPLPSLAPVWHAKWLLYNGDGEVRYFRRKLELGGAVKSATVTITADNGYELFVNGQRVGADGDWYKAETHDVAGLLKPGPNGIAVRVTNEGSIAGMLCEARITLRNGDLVRVATDGDWRMAKDPGEGWQSAAFDDSKWSAPEVGGSPPGASPWGEVPGLPPEPNTGKEIWYRFDLPPGAAKLLLPAGAKPLRLWVDGKGMPTPAASLDLGKPAGAEVRHVVLVIEGPNPLSPPILCDSDPSRILVGDWATEGLAGYVGEAAYDRVIDLPDEYAPRRLFLDLGQVGVAARVEINGKDAGTRVCTPYVLDLGKSVRRGKNRVHVTVANTLASGAKDGQAPPAGLLGPVRILAYQEVEVVVE